MGIGGIDILNHSFRFIEEELLYILRKLLEMRLWTGTLWATYQEKPSEVALLIHHSHPHESFQKNPNDLRWHTFSISTSSCAKSQPYPKSPSVWVMPSLSEVDDTTTVREDSAGLNAYQGQDKTKLDKRSSIGMSLGAKAKAVEIDSRQLARDCLQVLGKKITN
ncbi:hypothetical protein M422DRAFT_784193 [Sphaerobolus stellatus SS14]|uniref:Uncharacterized protein n=1 Tax=Sphaerobolus stellatus (strain SS14) TaxID=990650 RepID=A0A0C9ULS6_SPHS4|nr:hypothetical protein M422DRAFT_784193 [Sphaerobolus stellatus SS14]